MRDRIGFLNPYSIDTLNDRNWWVNPDTPEIVLPILEEAVQDYLRLHGMPSFGLKVTIRNRHRIYTQDDLISLICNRLKDYPFALFPWAWTYKTLKDEIERLAIDNTIKNNERWFDAKVKWTYEVLMDIKVPAGIISQKKNDKR